jgi:site-specific recombinase XerD
VDNEIKCMARDLAMKGYAQKTQDAYLKATTALLAHFGRPAASLSRDELRSYVELLSASGRGVPWQKTQLCALLFLYRKTLGQPELVSFVALPRFYSAVPEVLSLKEVHALLNAIKNRRYQAIAMVMYGAGLRIQEAIALETSDIDGQRGVIRVRHGKGNKAREAKLSESLYLSLRQYWDRERPAAPHLFASKTGRLPLPLTIREAVSKAAKDAHIKKHVTPHVLRHSFATHLLEQGVDVHVVSALLGHATLQSTARYARVTQKLVQQTPSPLDLLPRRRR